MLKQRVLTAIPLAAFVIWGIITQPVNMVFYALLFVIGISGWEWAQLSGVKDTFLRVIYAIFIAVGAFFMQQFIESSPEIINFLLSITVAAWFFAIYHMFSKGPGDANQSMSPGKLIIGVVALMPPVFALLLIRNEGSWWLFYCLSIVWVADIGAYFSGKQFGKNKLAEKLSPGKTREGMYGAVFATTVYSFFAGLFFELQVIQLLMLLIVSALATIVSVAGDLFVSLLKREKALKDTGHILPGHGGILDRIDSVLSSAPFLALLLNMVIFNA